MRSEDQLLLANKSTRRSRGLLFDNNWPSDRIIHGCLSSLAKKLPILKFCTRGIRLIISGIEWNQMHYFQSFLLKIIKKKSGTDIFYQIIAHVHFREILSGYFLFSLKLTKMSLFTPTYRRIELFVKVRGWNRNKMSYFETN
jgi:hypothetical protein